jgi:hypothetical protein
MHLFGNGRFRYSPGGFLSFDILGCRLARDNNRHETTGNVDDLQQT